MKKLKAISVILAGAMVFTACSSEPSGKVTLPEDSSSAVAEAGEADDKADDKEEKTDDVQEEKDTSSSSDAKALDEENDTDDEEVVEKKERVLTCATDDFKASLAYIKKHAADEEKPSISYRETEYTPEKREAKATYTDNQKEIDNRILTDEVKVMRLLRGDKTGSTLDVTVYTNPSDRMIDKITTVEYCADGRDITEYYFEAGKLTYAYDHKNAIYGTDADGKNYPGKKCYFSNDALVECVVDDKDVDYKSISYAAKDYEKLDDFSRTQFDQLEADMINKAYITYDYVKDVPSTTLIYGYVGDEFGGMLGNVHMTFTSKDNNYTAKCDTNSDGYFEIRVPKNSEDCYGLVCEYGDYTKSTVDDIDISKPMIDYSLGLIYMAEPGNNVHEPNTYLLNANYSSPKAIGNDEYCVTFTYDVSKGADLKSFAMNLNTGKSSTDAMTVIKASNDEYKYYVTDQRGGRSGNPMTYEMTSSDAVVRVYSKDGLVASFMAPVGRVGTVWEVFAIRNGEIVPINNTFYEGETEPFFK